MVIRLLRAYDRAVASQFAGARVFVLIALFALFTLGVFPAFRALAGPSAAGINLPGTRWAWTPAEGYALLDGLGESGRLVYALSIVSADMLYPLVSALMLGALMAIAWEHARPGAWDRRLIRLPLVYMLADYTENAGLVTMLAGYPQQLAGVAGMTATFTTIKWALVGLCVLMIAAGAVAASARRLTRRMP